MTSFIDQTIISEHSIVYAYGIIGNKIAQQYKEDAYAALTDHRSVRDTLISLAEQRHIITPVMEVSYKLPIDATTPDNAIRLAIIAENQAMQTYRLMIEKTELNPDKRLAFEWLKSASLRSSHWNSIMKITPSVPIFPGKTAQ